MSVQGGIVSDADYSLDLTGQICPMTFVRTRLVLDRMLAGQTLALLVPPGEPSENVPPSIEELGHEIVVRQDLPDGGLALRVIKAGER